MKIALCMAMKEAENAAAFADTLRAAVGA